jgi:hypothetical protein
MENEQKTSNEKLKLKNKNYYAENKVKILLKHKERVNCRFCGKEVGRGGLRSHTNKAICKKEQEIQKQLNELGKDI